MSYILDALKKSEQERKRGNVPDLLTVQEQIVLGPRKRPPWLYIISPVVLAVCSLAVWWVVSVNRAGVVPQRVLQQEQIPAKLPEGETPVSDTSVVPVARTEIRTPLAQVNEPVQKERTPPRAVPTARAAEPVETPSPRDTNLQPAPVFPADPGRIYAFKELPQSLQKSFPGIALTALMYSSDPASRVVRINDRMMREGQELVPGLKLVEISSDSVVMAGQGYRFSVLMKAGQ